MPSDKVYKSVSLALNDELAKVTDEASHIFLLQTWYRYMFPLIPFDTGVLASTIATSDRPLSEAEAMEKALQSIGYENLIRFKVPYASRQYTGEGFNFRKDNHPLAQANWGEAAWTLYGQQIADTFKDYLKKKG